MGWWTRAFGGNARAPRDVDTAVRGALLATLSRDWEEAERLLVAACRLDTDAVEPFLALARLLRSRGEVGRAIRIHQNLMLRLDGDSPDGRRALAGLAADFREGGFLRRAIAAYEDVLAGDSKNPSALHALASLHAEARDFERAIEMERRLARVERRDAAPAEARLRVQMAEAAHAEGKTEDARRALKRALKRDKQCVPAWLLLGEIEAERERPKAALEAWKRVPELDAQAGAGVYPRLEATFAALDKARDFETYLRKRLDAAPDDAACRIALARHLAARGAAEEGVAELRRVLSRDPEDVDARVTLGRLLLTENRDAEAVKEYAELLDALDRRQPVASGEPTT